MPRKKTREGARRLLDAWLPPANAGEPIGCLATTFTFDPVFFEEHCLSRFLRMETDPREDGAAYLIEREEKLAASRVLVLVDRSQADGSASARWDVLPVRLPGGGLFHPKIVVMAWQNAIRLMVGSANLTEPAHRKNQEISGLLDFSDGGSVAPGILGETLRFLAALAVFAPGDAEGGAKGRFLELVRQFSVMIEGWTVAKSRRTDRTSVVPVFLAPVEGFNTPVPARLGHLVREHGGPAHSAWVVSPFFDKGAGKTYGPTTALLASLTDRGQRFVLFAVPAEDLPDGRIRVRAPWNLVRSGKKDAEFQVTRVDTEGEGEFRPLHAKLLWLWSDRWHAYCVGSSNFTTAGLGLAGSSTNAEANLAYVFPEDRQTVRAMEDTLPLFGDEIEDLSVVVWEPVDESEGEARGGAVLPLGFQEALFEPDGEGGWLILRFGEELPDQWRIMAADDQVLHSAEEWQAAGGPEEVRLPWAGRAVPTAVQVHWQVDTESRSAPWPVNVTDSARLPPPEELRGLSLETLIEILGSRLPLHEAVLRAKAGQSQKVAGDSLSSEIDPHRRVNTETFLLQRTRRVAGAIEQLIERLGRPVLHREALMWRLRGPVGPLALARALATSARSPGEACFLLSEVALALRRVATEKVAVGVPVEEVRQEVKAVREEIATLARLHLEAHEIPLALAAYVTKVLMVIA
jgi:hypothetical protein